MSFQPVVLWHSKHSSTRACSLPAILCEIIAKWPMRWLGGAWWHCTHSLDRDEGCWYPRAITAESLEMRIPAIVAPGAIEDLARGDRVELIDGSNAQRRLQRLERDSAVGIPASRACQSPCPDLSERHVVHQERPDPRPLMLDVTCRTLLDARVERGRLTTEQSFRTGMARRALRRRHAHSHLVARCASVGEVRVPRRQRSRADELLNRR